MDIAMAHGFFGFNPFFAFFGFLFNLLFFVLFIGLIVWVLRGFRRGRWGRGPWRGMGYQRFGHWMGGSSDAMNTLRERFARGEINREEYERIKAGLERENADEGDWRPFWKQDGALEVARTRFAKGEITLEEFEAIKKGLQS
jgi:putative membrane protein